MADFRVTGADGAPLDDDTLTRPAGHALPGGSDVARTPAYDAAPARTDDVVLDDPDQARAAIERTRSRMSETIDTIEEVLLRKKEQIQEKMDVLAPVKHNPLPAAAAVFGVGLVLGFATGGGREHELEYDGPREGNGPDLAAERRWRQRHGSLQAKHRELEQIVKEQRRELKELRKEVKRSGRSGGGSSGRSLFSRGRDTGYETETVRYDRDLRYGGTTAYGDTAYGSTAAYGGTSPYGATPAYGGTSSRGDEEVLDASTRYEGITAYGDTGYTDDAMDATTLYDRDELYDGSMASEQDTVYGASAYGSAYGSPSDIRSTGYGSVYDRDQAEYRYEDLDEDPYDDEDDDGTLSAMGDAVTSLKETVVGGIADLVSDAFGRLRHRDTDFDNEQDRVINPT